MAATITYWSCRLGSFGDTEGKLSEQPLPHAHEEPSWGAFTRAPQQS